MPTAACVIRSGPSYRQEQFVRGLKACGFRVELKAAVRPDSGDIIVVWNRYGQFERYAKRYEDRGCPVIVAENGWIGQTPDGHKLYALCRDHHNGAGRWKEGTEDRWSPLGIELKPWRSDGTHILVLPQRGIGPPGVAMPGGWLDDVVRRLRKATRRPVRIRKHPGLEKTPLEPDLEDCWACVTWASGAAIKAMAAGIPVFHELERWIGAPAARFGMADLENPFLGDRLPMFRRLAWAQWSIEEIATGEPFRRLLSI